MTADEILALAPVVMPAVTALIGLFTPSPGPAVVKWSATRWTSLAQRVAAIWQSKPVQAEVALEISPAMQLLINQAVTAAVAALSAQPPANVWLAPATAPAVVKTP